MLSTLNRICFIHILKRDVDVIRLTTFPLSFILCVRACTFWPIVKSDFLLSWFEAESLLAFTIYSFHFDVEYIRRLTVTLKISFKNRWLPSYETPQLQKREEYNWLLARRQTGINSYLLIIFQLFFFLQFITNRNIIVASRMWKNQFCSNLFFLIDSITIFPLRSSTIKETIRGICLGHKFISTNSFFVCSLHHNMCWKVRKPATHAAIQCHNHIQS